MNLHPLIELEREISTNVQEMVPFLEHGVRVVAAGVERWIFIRLRAILSTLVGVDWRGLEKVGN